MVLADVLVFALGRVVVIITVLEYGDLGYTILEFSVNALLLCQVPMDYCAGHHLLLYG